MRVFADVRVRARACLCVRTLTEQIKNSKQAVRNKPNADCVPSVLFRTSEKHVIGALHLQREEG